MSISRRIFLYVILMFAPFLAKAALQFSETVPFSAGVGGYASYRIPAIVRSTNGTLLAFCEGRKNSGADSGDIDIVLRRSTNNGATWLSQNIVQEEGGTASITIGNPSPVVDEITGAIHLVFCRNNSLVYHTVSVDDGITWSIRNEITPTVKSNTWGWYATGPGHGIQLKRGSRIGRLVIPADHNLTNGVNGAQAIYSDDHGATWKLGAVNDATGGVNPNETQCVELVTNSPSGGSRIYFSTRDQNGSATGNRGEAYSLDGGQTFLGPFTNRVSFICPVVQGSLARVRATDFGSSSNRILFACPNNASARQTISVWSSTNESISWGQPIPVWDGPSAYSDMVTDTNGNIFLLYEKGNSSAYETITLAKFNEAWLDSSIVPEENPEPAFWNFEERAVGQTVNTNVGAILDIHPFGLNNNLTSQRAFNYIAGPANFGGGTAIAFDGTGGLQMSDVATSNHFDFGSNDSFTVEAVFRIPSGSAQTGALVSKDYGTLLPSWWFRIESGKLRFLVCDGTTQFAVFSPGLVNDGLWHHAAAVRDATNTSAKWLRLYLDGIQITNLADTTVGSLANSQPFSIGCFGVATNRNLTGDIDMVRITPEALQPNDFVGHWTQFDADNDLIPDVYERATYGTLETLGANDDADGDGESDLMEYVLGSDPLDPNSTPRITINCSSTNVTLTFLQRSLPAWLNVTAESSSNLIDWSGCVGPVSTNAAGNGIFSRQQIISYPGGRPTQLFFRAKVTIIP